MLLLGWTLPKGMSEDKNKKKNICAYTSGNFNVIKNAPYRHLEGNEKPSQGIKPTVQTFQNLYLFFFYLVSSSIINLMQW